MRAPDDAHDVYEEEDAYTELRPSSIGIAMPVIQELAGSRRNDSAEDTSVGSPSRFMACICFEEFAACSLSVILYVMGERVRPGATALKRRLLLAYVQAAERAREITAPLAAAMAS